MMCILKCEMYNIETSEIFSQCEIKDLCSFLYIYILKYFIKDLYSIIYEN